METSTKTNLVTLEPGAKAFIANGRQYYIEGSLSAERYAVYKKYEIEYGYKTTFMDFFNSLKELWGLLNAQKFGECAVLVHNLMSAMGKADRNEDEARNFCTLFINTDDEDRRWYDEQVMQQKLTDWAEAGIDQTFFQQLAVNLIYGYTETLKSFSPDSSLSN